MPRVKTGLEVLITEKLDLVMGQRIGLITNHSAVMPDLTHATDALISAGVNLTALFSPEHGIRGQIADGAQIPSSIEPKTGLTVHSLHGETRKPTAAMLECVDILLFDIQDVGARFYTFLYTMALSMQACGELGKRLIVLDRPNPIGGTALEGPVLDPQFSSFVGMYPIPIRYGLTIGEIARLFGIEFRVNPEVDVVSMHGWDRSMDYDATGLIWVPPSPGIPTLDTAFAYPGTCLLEGTNVSEGRGTTIPFQVFGAPWIDSNALTHELNSADLPGVRFRPVSFIPTSSKYKDEACEGTQIHILNRKEFRPVLTGVKILEVIHQLWHDSFQFRAPEADGRHFFDLLAGTETLRTALLAGKTAEDITSTWTDQLERYESIRTNYLFY